MGDETEYYWDEDTQTYYYWDESTQAYYPWVEEEQVSTLGQHEQEPQHLTAVDVTGVNVSSPSVQPSTAADDTSENPQGSEFYQRGGVRNLTRKLSMAEHGGLAGILQIVNAERANRKGGAELTDESIRESQQKERVRTLIQQAGIVEQSPMYETVESTSQTSAKPELEHTGSDGIQMRDVFQNTAREPQQSYRRRSTVRFGTTEFNDPSFQNRLEAMLGSKVKK